MPKEKNDEAADTLQEAVATLMFGLGRLGALIDRLEVALSGPKEEAKPDDQS